MDRQKGAMENVEMNSFWQDRRVFVTGATGLVGSWLVKKLVASSATVVCLVRDWVPESELIKSSVCQKVHIIRGDLCDAPLIERILGEYEIQCVFHLAAQTIVEIANRNPVSTFESNIRGTWLLLESCRRTATISEIVLASSDKAYGSHEQLPYTEVQALQGCHPYDVSKSCSDLLAQTYAKTYGLPVAITRCGNFYGGGDLNWNRLIPGTIRSLVRGNPPIIRSDGNSIRDYFYIEDGVEAYMLLASRLAEMPSLKGEAFNFSNELQMDVLSLVRKIIQLMGADVEPQIRNNATNEITHQFLSAEKAHRILDWYPRFTLDEGLMRTITWYKNYFQS
jgi:CDP-glucose 4,6-dehydratase